MCFDTTKPKKTKQYGSDRKPILPNLKQMNYVSRLHLGSVDIKPSLWYKILVSCWTCMTISQEQHLRRLRRLRGIICSSTMQRLVLSRLDYFNAVLSGLPSTTLDPLRRVLNASVPIVTDLGLRATWPNRWRSSIGYQSNTVSISTYVWWCTPLWLVNARNTFVTLSILCQYYLDGKTLSSCEWPVRHLQDKNCFQWKSFLRGWSTRVEHASIRHYRHHKPRSF